MNDVTAIDLLKVLGGLLLVVVLAAATWFGITKPRGGGARLWTGDESKGGDDLVFPCQHPTRRLFVTDIENGIALACRCAKCDVDLTGDLTPTLESDGRIVIENNTDREFAIIIDGEIHNLVPAALRLPTAHVVRSAAVPIPPPPPQSRAHFHFPLEEEDSDLHDDVADGGWPIDKT